MAMPGLSLAWLFISMIGDAVRFRGGVKHLARVGADGLKRPTTPSRGDVRAKVVTGERCFIPQTILR